MNRLSLVIVIGLLAHTSLLCQTHTPSYYCHHCCGFVGYRLLLQKNNRFEIKWTDGQDSLGGVTFVSGSYVRERKRVSLFIESTMEKIEIRKVGNSDSLIIDFDIRAANDGVLITDEQMQRDVMLATKVELKQYYQKSFLYSQRNRSLHTPFNVTEEIAFRYEGMSALTVVLNEPGKYNMQVTMVPDMGMSIHPEQTIILKRRKWFGNEKLKYPRHRKARFVTKICAPIIT